MKYRFFIKKKIMGDFILDPSTGLCTNSYMVDTAYTFTSVSDKLGCTSEQFTNQFIARNYESTNKWQFNGWTPYDFSNLVTQITDKLALSIVNFTDNHNSLFGTKLDGDRTLIPDIQNCNVYVFSGYPTLTTGGTSKTHHTFVIYYKGNERLNDGVVQKELFVSPPYFGFLDYNNLESNNVGFNDYSEFQDTWSIQNYYIF